MRRVIMLKHVVCCKGLNGVCVGSDIPNPAVATVLTYPRETALSISNDYEVFRGDPFP